jgi:hypothetical protein
MDKVFVCVLLTSVFLLKMHQQETTATWKRADISFCTCREKSYRYVHCHCKVCKGRATDRSTEMRHWKEANRASNSVYSPNNNNSDDTSIGQIDFMEPSVIESDHEMDVDNLVDMETGNDDYQEFQEFDCEQTPSCDNSEDFTTGTNTCNAQSYDDNPLKKLVIDAVLNALKIQKDSGVSIKTFEDILENGKKLLLDSCSLDEKLLDRDILTTLWPKSWNDVQKLLKEEGYSDAKEYFICFCYYEKSTRSSSASKIKYNGKYSVMENKNDMCRHCGKQGFITYYYLGLENKVKNWFCDPNMCQKMVSHWKEREHWLGKNDTWPLKNQIWDGKRWLELQWFWDPNKTWVIPCCCEYCGNTISVDQLINSEDGMMESVKIVECPECLESFEHPLKTATGCPLNIALIGHWDGWQAFGSSTRSCGSLEVSIANLKKEDRSHTDEVYVLGFVPLAFVPKLPETFDPFLEPLMRDIYKGFIHGFEVDRNSLSDFEIDDFDLSNLQRVRILLLCWSGDHPGQCEIGKLLNQGRCPCRRCKLIGQHLPLNDSNKHMYYGDSRFCYRHQWEPRNISEMLTDLYDIEAESRTSIRKQMSSQKGVTGVSLLHKYLYPLYGFDILQDLTFDIFRTVCLNVVKSQAERLLDKQLIKKNYLDKEIKNFP